MKLTEKEKQNIYDKEELNEASLFYNCPKGVR